MPQEKPEETKGRIARTMAESEPWWPGDPVAPEGAPNIVLCVFDDVPHHGTDEIHDAVTGLVGPPLHLD